MVKEIKSYTPKEFENSFKGECLQDARKYIKENPKDIYLYDDIVNVLRKHYKTYNYDEASYYNDNIYDIKEWG